MWHLQPLAWQQANGGRNQAGAYERKLSENTGHFSSVSLSLQLFWAGHGQQGKCACNGSPYRPPLGGGRQPSPCLFLPPLRGPTVSLPVSSCECACC